MAPFGVLFGCSRIFSFLPDLKERGIQKRVCMKRFTPWKICLLLLLLALSLQGCFGSGGNNNHAGNTITTNSNGNNVSLAQNLFKGKIYFTIDHNLWVTDSSGAPRELLP